MVDKSKAYSEISAWLNSEMKILEGMKLHTLYSQNARNKKFLATHIAMQKRMLPVYLRELLLLFKPSDIIIEEIKKEDVAMPTKLEQDTAQKLKKEFPKIEFNELPETLKQLTFKRYYLWERSKFYHDQMQKALSDENRFFAAKNCIECVEENWQIWDELNEWHRHKRILGKHAKFLENAFEKWIEEQEKTPDKGTKEFMILRRRARNNLFTLLRKQERTKEQEAKVQEWIYKHDLVSTKINEPRWTKTNATIILDESPAEEKTDADTTE